MNLVNKIKALLVDDEPSAINNLSFLLKKHCPSIEIIAIATDVDEAVLAIHKQKPDVVFLDIEMPKKSGFELFEETQEQFQTIFVTAYDEYAIKAFEVSALDYLLKPIEIERLKNAVSKLENASVTKQVNINAFKNNFQENEVAQIVIPYKSEQYVVDIDNVICFEASGGYCLVHFCEELELKSHLYSKNLRYFQEILKEGNKFFRVHRSWIINLKKIQSFNKKTNIITLCHNIEIPLSRGKIKEFLNLY